MKNNEYISVVQYQRNLMKILPGYLSRELIEKLEKEKVKIVKERNSRKIINNKKFLQKCDKKEKKVLNNIHKNLEKIKF